ncbi:MAG: hypothetical protein HDT13_08645 [Butyrivibrio sp.]|nr:hypothetical protein [Butyrivibrio sp.]
MRLPKKELIKNLKLAYEAPEPEKRDEFCQRFDSQYISMGRFFLTQIPYIRKWSWIISTLIFGIGVFVSVFVKDWAVWVVSAFAPILALTMLIENAKSSSCNMDELECATRFSLKSLLFARMTVLSVFHGIVMAALIPLCVLKSAMPVLTGGLYILLPYFLTVFCGAVLLRKIHRRESMSICIGIPVLISFLMIITRYMCAFLYEQESVKWWALALAVLAAASVREWILYIGRNTVRI